MSDWTKKVDENLPLLSSARDSSAARGGEDRRVELVGVRSHGGDMCVVRGRYGGSLSLRVVDHLTGRLAVADPRVCDVGVYDLRYRERRLRSDSTWVLSRREMHRECVVMPKSRRVLCVPVAISSEDGTVPSVRLVVHNTRGTFTRLPFDSLRLFPASPDHIVRARTKSAQHTTKTRRRRGRTVVTCANPLLIKCDQDLPRVQLTVLEPTYDTSGAIRGTNVLYEASVRFDSETQSLIIEANDSELGRKLPEELLAYKADVRLRTSNRGVSDRILCTPQAGVLVVAN